MMSDLPEYEDSEETKSTNNNTEPIKITEQNAEELMKMFNR